MKRLGTICVVVGFVAATGAWGWVGIPPGYLIEDLGNPGGWDSLNAMCSGVSDNGSLAAGTWSVTGGDPRYYDGRRSAACLPGG